MGRGYDQEFGTVARLLDSTFETRAVDAFCLAWIKYERQARKVCSFLVFQSSTLNRDDASKVRSALGANLGISHTDFRSAVERLSGVKLKERFGERYAVLNRALLSASTARDKIFHGQQTGRKYSRDELIELVEFIQEWCKIFGEFAAEAFGYDGFSGANSLYKADNEKLTAQVDSVVAKNGWEAFIKSM